MNASELLISLAQLKKAWRIANPPGKKIIEKESLKLRELLYKATHKYAWHIRAKTLQSTYMKLFTDEELIILGQKVQKARQMGGEKIKLKFGLNYFKDLNKLSQAAKKLKKQS